jgi:hypothetical protein
MFRIEGLLPWWSRKVIRLWCFVFVFVFVLVFVPLEDFCRSAGLLSLSCEAIPYIFVFDQFATIDRFFVLFLVLNVLAVIVSSVNFSCKSLLPFINLQCCETIGKALAFSYKVFTLFQKYNKFGRGKKHSNSFV